MPLETIWFTFEIEFFDADSLTDRIPADDEREARATIRRVYPNARVVRLVEVERKENYFARFDPMTANRRIAGKASKAHENAIISFLCPHCEHRIETRQAKESAPEKCPQCGWRYENRPINRTLTVIAPLELARESEAPVAKAVTGDLDGVPWFEVLDISPEANIRAIRSAYLNLIRLYHPDKVSHLGADLIGFAEARTASLNRALKEALRARG